MTAERRRPRSRARRVVSLAVLTVVGLLVAAVVGIVIWSQVGVMDAEAGAWDEVRQDDRIAISDTGGNVVLPVLSISGSEDGLSTPEKIRDAAPLLPADAEFVEVPGAAHALFGDYGPQAGDGTPSIEDADMTAEITASVAGLLPRL